MYGKENNIEPEEYLQHFFLCSSRCWVPDAVLAATSSTLQTPLSIVLFRGDLDLPDGTLTYQAETWVSACALALVLERLYLKST